ncbi:MAG: carbamoyltransferase [Gammaproteobacteria bacterium]
MTRILGISAYYHDSAAALVEDGVIIAAAQEERFSRVKHDPRFPATAIRWCLGHARVALHDIDYIVFYDKPLLKFERLLETYLAVAPRGLGSFIAAMPVWMKEKLFLKQMLRRELAALVGTSTADLPPLLFSRHHLSHAASAFFPSPCRRAAVLCLDGVGEWATTSTWLGRDNHLQGLWEIHFPHSLGLLYSAFTYYCGFSVNSGEYKLMGLAPYGEPRYAQLIRDELIDVKDDGTFRLNMRYFDYPHGLRMTGERFERLLGRARREPESGLDRHYMDAARSIQQVTEEVVLRLARSLRQETGERSLCLAGGVALNCVANGRLLREAGYETLWIQPAAGDAGGAIGAALGVWHEYLGKDRSPNPADGMHGALLGPEFSEAESREAATSAGLRVQRLEDDALLQEVASRLAAGEVVGWFQGAMEFGPRALGNRSILGDPRSPDMQRRINLKIKFRESFRPFAPAVLAERCSDWFDLDEPSPYMLLVAPVAEARRCEAEEAGTDLDRLKVARSAIAAVTHVDYSARIQTVDGRYNPRFRALLEAFERCTGVPVLVNTSFNVRGEPVVCTPAEAVACFLKTEMDTLVLGNLLATRVAEST